MILTTFKPGDRVRHALSNVLGTVYGVHTGRVWVEWDFDRTERVGYLVGSLKIDNTEPHEIVEKIGTPREKVLQVVHDAQRELLASAAGWRPELMVIRAKEILTNGEQSPWTSAIMAAALLLTALESTSLKL